MCAIVGLLLTSFCLWSVVGNNGVCIMDSLMLVDSTCCGCRVLFWSKTMCCRWFLHLASGPAVYAGVFFLLSSLITLPALTAWSLAILCQDVGLISQAFPFLVADWKVWSPVVMEPAANYPYIFGIRLPSIWLTWRNPLCHPWCSIANLLAVLFCVRKL